MIDTTNDSTKLLEALDVLGKLIAHHVVAELRAGDVGMVDQTVSPLGARRHCAACRRRVAAGDGTAAIVGRRHLMTSEAVQAELQAASAKPRKRTRAEREPTVRDELEQELGLRLVGGGK